MFISNTVRPSVPVPGLICYVTMLLQVSGIKFEFDPSREPGSRIVPESVSVQSQPLNLEKIYRLCTKSYLANGKDGYDCLAKAKVLVNEDDGPQLSTIVQNHFQAVKIIRGSMKPDFAHRQSIIPVVMRRGLSRQFSVVTEEDATTGDDEVDSAKKNVLHRRRWKKARIALAFARHRGIQEAEKRVVDRILAPEVQHRIGVIGSG